jgi:hypothetical protein
MQRNYNFIYSKLVEDDSDLIGLIAYSLYKKHKIEFIEKQKQDGKDVSDSDLIPFNDFSSSDSSLENYKIKAEIIMQGFIDNVLDETIEEIETSTVNRHSEILKSIIKPLTSGFWGNVWAGLLSAFIFAIILAVIAFLLQFQGAVFNIQVEKPATEINNQRK